MPASFDWTNWVFLPLLIFGARIVDVSLGTMRFIFLYRGYRKLAPLLGFLEITVWLLAIRGVLVNMKNPVCFVAYAAGFAMGSYVGILIEDKLSIGMVLFRLVLTSDPAPFIKFMKENDFGFTVVEGEGTHHRVKILFSVVTRKDMKRIMPVIQSLLPRAFFTLETVRSVRQGVFPGNQRGIHSALFREYRKAK